MKVQPAGYDDEKLRPFVMAFFNLRRAVGWIGILLPPVLLLVTSLREPLFGIQNSISHYYYTGSRSILVGALCAVAFFLLAYPGYTRRDSWMCNLAGFCAIMIAFFPTPDFALDPAIPDTLAAPMVRGIVPANDQLRDSVNLYVHYGSAFTFFLILALLAIFEFTKSDTSEDQQTELKKSRNRIYRICGIVMLICLVLIAACVLIPRLETALDGLHPVLWLETVALLAFGFSWLIKGEMFLRDNDLLEYVERNPEASIEPSTAPSTRTNLPQE